MKPLATAFDRDAQIERHIGNDRLPIWDMAVIGGGATGVGIALDAANRGYSVCLFEQSDFGKGTSSRSTKLVHGGVRYLKQGNIALVRDALHERRTMLDNAPHVVHDLPFIIPCQSLWQALFYGVGLKLYDALAGRRNFAPSQWLTQSQVLAQITTMDAQRCVRGILYHDGQFDDARYLIDMARTASYQSACLINYAPVKKLSKNASGQIVGVVWQDLETLREFETPARIVINATGPFCDSVRQMENSSATPIVAASQGVHLVLPKRFLPGNTAMIVPKTSDGRVVFLIPWLDRVVLGTTDTPIANATLEPMAQNSEIEFLLETASRYLTPAPTKADVLSVFTGIRPLVSSSTKSKTSALSRDHTIIRSSQGLLTITGGKWTTYRKMAEDCVDRAASYAGLPNRPCRTATLRIVHPDLATDGPKQYFSDSLTICDADVVRAVRSEMARSVEDVLARRTRCLFLDARAAVDVAPRIAAQMAVLLNKNESWQKAQLASFQETSRCFLVDCGTSPVG